jgi:predicted phosphodiesterase
MEYAYRHFISQNVAPKGAKYIGVYDANNIQIYTIPLGGLSRPLGKKLYSWGVFADIHLYPLAAVEWKPEKKFDAALTYLESQSCALCVQCGDFTQTGLYREGKPDTLAPEQFDAYKQARDKHPNIPIHGICGNHESYVVPIRNNLTELKDYTGMDLYYTVSQGDDLFIFLSQPSAGQVVGDDGLQFLHDTLEENRNKRCFVFVHAYIEDDSGDPLDYRENSIFEDWGNVRKTLFMNLLRHYKNTILFHGHSHTKYKNQQFDKTANYTERNGFKSVHVPSLGRPRDLDQIKKETKDDMYASEGCVIDVYDNCIVLNSMNFIDNTPIPLGTY